jgi:activating signal cointegrator complex subunit 1
MSEEKRDGAPGPSRKPRPFPKREKRPPLTHFLCLPLVNDISLPQLESSLSTFKAAIPSVSHTDENGSVQNQVSAGRPLIPDGAVRPVGTLHLTLGVMSLPTKDRLEEALQFFHSLDLASIMHEAEENARKSKRFRKRSSSPRHQSDFTGAVGEHGDSHSSRRLEHEGDSASAVVSRGACEPLTISLESLHALPRGRAATVLHAAPVDSTSRLYPFCVLLRNKFLEAGFLQGDHIKNKPSSGEPEPQKAPKDIEMDPGDPTGTMPGAYPNLNEGHQSRTDTPIENNTALLQEMPVDLADEAAQAHSQTREPKTTTVVTSPQTKPKLKVRPLLLHATVVNTIYVRGRRRGQGPGNSGNRRNSQYTFDARDILAHYRDYYLDSERATPRSPVITLTSHLNEAERQQIANNETGTESASNSASGTDDNSSEIRDSPPEKKQKMSSSKRAAAFPFVWAKDFPLETITICEMGAKKLDPDDSGMNARLAEKYRVVAERSLDFTSSGPSKVVVEGQARHQDDQESNDAGSSDGSVEGGVKI